MGRNAEAEGAIDGGREGGRGRSETDASTMAAAKRGVDSLTTADEAKVTGGGGATA